MDSGVPEDGLLSAPCPHQVSFQAQGDRVAQALGVVVRLTEGC